MIHITKLAGTKRGGCLVQIAAANRMSGRFGRGQRAARIDDRRAVGICLGRGHIDIKELERREEEGELDLLSKVEFF